MNVVSKTSWPHQWHDYAGSLCIVELCLIDLQYLLQGATFSVGIAIILCTHHKNFVTTSKPINCIPTNVGKFIANGVHAAAP